MKLSRRRRTVQKFPIRRPLARQAQRAASPPDARAAREREAWTAHLASLPPGDTSAGARAGRGREGRARPTARFASRTAVSREAVALANGYTRGRDGGRRVLLGRGGQGADAEAEAPHPGHPRARARRARVQARQRPARARGRRAPSPAPARAPRVVQPRGQRVEGGGRARDAAPPRRGGPRRVAAPDGPRRRGLHARSERVRSPTTAPAPALASPHRHVRANPPAMRGGSVGARVQIASRRVSLASPPFLPADEPPPLPPTPRPRLAAVPHTSPPRSIPSARSGSPAAPPRRRRRRPRRRRSPRRRRRRRRAPSRRLRRTPPPRFEPPRPRVAPRGPITRERSPRAPRPPPNSPRPRPRAASPGARGRRRTTTTATTRPRRVVWTRAWRRRCDGTRASRRRTGASGANTTASAPTRARLSARRSRARFRSATGIPSSAHTRARRRRRRAAARCGFPAFASRPRTSGACSRWASR